MVRLAGVNSSAKLGANCIHQRRPEQTRRRGLAAHLRQAMICAIAHVICGRLTVAAHVMRGSGHFMAGHRHGWFGLGFGARRPDRQKAERQSEDRGEHHTHEVVIRMGGRSCHCWPSIFAAS